MLSSTTFLRKSIAYFCDLNKILNASVLKCRNEYHISHKLGQFQRICLCASQIFWACMYNRKENQIRSKQITLNKKKRQHKSQNKKTERGLEEQTMWKTITSEFQGELNKQTERVSCCPEAIQPRPVQSLTACQINISKRRSLHTLASGIDSLVL